jgi:2-oxoglutarate dehydrogenase E1 component
VQGRFLEVLPDTTAEPAAVRSVLLCSGKLSFELEARRQESSRTDVVIVRVEQLYPFPQAQILAELDRYPGANVRWVQEEPENMGSLRFVDRRLREAGRSISHVSRPESGSPASGSATIHQLEQHALIDAGFAP